MVVAFRRPTLLPLDDCLYALQVERMNRTIKETTVKRFHYDSHEQLRRHLADFMAAYNFVRCLKTLSGLTLYEYIAKIWTSDPDRFIADPIHQMPDWKVWCPTEGKDGHSDHWRISVQRG